MIEYLPLIYLGVGLTGTYFFIRLLLNHMTQLKKVKRSHDIQKDKKSFENELENLVDNAPDMYAKVLAELEYLRANGADEKQMKSLEQKAQMLKFAVDNKEIINVAGKPIFRYIGKLVGGFGR